MGQKLVLPFVLYAFVFLSPGFLSAGRAEQRLKIVTSTTGIASIVHYIAGELADVRSLRSHHEHPYVFWPSYEHAEMMKEAHLWIRSGLGLDSRWESQIIADAAGPHLKEGSAGHLDLSEDVLRISLPRKYISPSLYPWGNPYYWTDPLNGRIAAESVAGYMSKILPAHSELFESRLEEFKKELDALMFGHSLVRSVGGSRLWKLEIRGRLHEYLKEQGTLETLGGWKKRTSSLSGEEIASDHICHHYAARRFGLDIPVVLRKQPGRRPDPAHLMEAADKIQSADINVVVKSPALGADAASFIARRTDVESVVLPLEVHNPPSSSGYFDLIDQIVESFVESLEEGNESMQCGKKRTGSR